MIITIARQCGSGGHEIGKELASRLGLELYDRKKLEEEAKKLGKLDENKEFFFHKKFKNQIHFFLQKEKCISKKLYAKKHAKNFLRNTSPEFLKAKVS